MSFPCTLDCIPPELEPEQAFILKPPGTGLVTALSKVIQKARALSPKAPLPHSHADFMRLLTDGSDAAIAHAGLLVVAGGQSHITKLAQLWKLDRTAVVVGHYIAVN